MDFLFGIYHSESWQSPKENFKKTQINMPQKKDK